MSSLKDGIQSILNQIGIDEQHKPMMDMIKNTGVTESNVMEILGVIEHKTNDLISNYINISTQSNDNDQSKERQTIINISKDNINNNNNLDDKQAEAASLGIGIGAASLQPLVATPLSIFDDFSDEEDEYNNDDEHIPIPQDQVNRK